MLIFNLIKYEIQLLQYAYLWIFKNIYRNEYPLFHLSLQFLFVLYAVHLYVSEYILMESHQRRHYIRQFFNLNLYFFENLFISSTTDNER